jgi:ribose transport system substrate-binding protein
VIEYLLDKHPDLKGIYATNLDATQLVGKTLKKLEKTDLNFVGFDGGKEQVQLLEDGIIKGIIVQNPYAIGYATVVAAARVSLGLANESYVNSGYTWVTLDNMKKKEISSMLY